MALIQTLTFIARQAAPSEQIADELKPGSDAQDSPDDGSGNGDSGDMIQSHIDFEQVKANVLSGFETFQENFISWGSLWQLLAVLAALGVAYFASRYPARQLRTWAEARESRDVLTRLAQSVAKIVWPAFTVVLLWIATAAFEAAGLRNEGLRVAASLMNAWIVVRFVTANLKPGFWQTAIAIVAWTIAALYILHLLDPVFQYLSKVHILH